jgi:serine/threonine protein phosphatase PrpC
MIVSLKLPRPKTLFSQPFLKHSVTLNFSARSDAGQREINEDSYCAEQIGDYWVFGVADGLGGHAAGEVASEIAIECLRNALKLDGGDPKDALREAVSEADKQILVHGEKFPESRGMATTLIAAVVDDDLNCTVINVGDSRAHIITVDKTVTTKDHSYVNELVECGEIQADDTWKHPLGNVLCQAIGDPEGVVRPDFYEVNLRNTFLLLSSDGLHDFVRKEKIREVVILNHDELEKSCDDLVEMALEEGSDDNITLVLVHGE